jgi:hypothetical protein
MMHDPVIECAEHSHDAVRRRDFYRDVLGYDPEFAGHEANVATVRETLLAHPDVHVLLECFNHIESDYVKSNLSEDELRRVSFTYVFFGEMPE